MLDRNRKILFIHVPKTGGYTISQCLSAAGLRMEFEGSKHSPLSSYKNVDDYYKFAFVRNPFDMLVSRYFHNLVNRERDKYKNYGSFAKFIKKAKHKPQKKLLVNEAGELAMNFIGKFELLPEHYDIVCRQLGIPNKMPEVGILNASEHDAYQKYYDAESRKIVEDAMAEDLEAFHYEF